MCEFCTKHGEGRKWYLEARNYSEELLNDMKRQKLIRDFFYNFPQLARKVRRGFEKLRSAPRLIAGLLRGRISAKFKKEHFGQVVPVEDVQEIFNMCSTIIRIPCVCRRETIGKDAYYCMGVTLNADSLGMGDLIDDSYLQGPDSKGLERLSRDQALDLIKGFEKEGLMHSVWTFGTPFIGGVCNCDLSDCLAMQATVRNNLKVMFKGEYVAEIDIEKCNGCRACMRVCQFGALGYSAANKYAFVNIYRCFGCGVCRAACPNDAIKLRPRAEVPAIANNW